MSTEMRKMSTNGPQEEYPKDSFDRYGDDLCGLVLSYLSFEDSFRYEYVSKQWQRLVFKYQEHFQMTKFLDKCLITRGNGVEYINWEPLLSIIRKCPNITSICIWIDSEATERVFEILINSYKHSLIAIEVRFDKEIDVKIMDRIVCKYGSLLTAISVPRKGYEVFIRHSKSYTKLKQLLSSSSGSLLSAIVTENNEILVKNLTQINFYYNSSDWQRLQAFVDYYKNSLKSIDLGFNEMSVEQCIPVLKLLSQMQSLRELNIDILLSIGTFHIQSIVDYHCDEFVNQWPQLKRYQLFMMCLTEPQVRRLYESVNRMKRLRRVELRLNNSYQNYFQNTIELTPKSLSPLKRLTHLELCFCGYFLNETFFDSIDTHLPHIESLIMTTLLAKRSPLGIASIRESVANLPKLKYLKHF